MARVNFNSWKMKCFKLWGLLDPPAARWMWLASKKTVRLVNRSSGAVETAFGERDSFLEGDGKKS